jgi:hypothetical protein
MPPLRKVVSGGQTGVDQGALRGALARGLEIGGWCPPGHTCEDGAIPDVFPLRETPDERSEGAPDIPRSRRTEWNARDSDATLLIRPAQFDPPDAGTRWAAECASRFGRPVTGCDPAMPDEVARVRDWLARHDVSTLNVAGPSERACPGIGAATEHFISRLIDQG